MYSSRVTHICWKVESDERLAPVMRRLGSKSGEPFSSSLGWLVERIADESADIAPAAAAVGPPRAEESAESSAYGKAW